MTVRTLPLELELVIYAGASFRRDFRWRPDGGTPVDFTGWTASMLIGPYHGASTTTLDTTNGHIVLTNDGIIRLLLDPADTVALEPADGFDLAYQLDLEDPAGFVIRFLRGRVTVISDVDPP